MKRENKILFEMMYTTIHTNTAVIVGRSEMNGYSKMYVRKTFRKCMFVRHS